MRAPQCSAFPAMRRHGILSIMSTAAKPLMTVDEFFAWADRRADRVRAGRAGLLRAAP
jgi:hypothetical protein